MLEKIDTHDSDSKTLTKAVMVWVPIMLTSILYVAFKHDGFSGIYVVCYYLMLLNILWFGFFRWRSSKSIKRNQIAFEGFLNVSMLICFQIIYPDWYIYGWIAAILGLIALLRFICSEPTNSQ